MSALPPPEESSFWLPLYGSMCCRLAAQPRCMATQMMCGFLKVQVSTGTGWGWDGDGTGTGVEQGQAALGQGG